MLIGVRAICAHSIAGCAFSLLDTHLESPDPCWVRPERLGWHGLKSAPYRSATASIRLIEGFMAISDEKD
jgi:hypothetical protein